MRDLQAGDDQTISVVITYDRTLWRRAMTGWWQSVVPPAPFVRRVIFWAVVWGLVGLLAMILAVLGLSPAFVLAGLIGAGFLVGVFAYLQRTRMDRFWDVVGTHWDKAGAARADFGPGGIHISDSVSRRELAWPAVDAIGAQRGVTIIRTGIAMIAVPDDALPEGMTGKAFRAKLEGWRNA